MSSRSNGPFENAHNAFLATLSPKDRPKFSSCSSPDDIVKALKELECLSTQGQKRTLNRCLGVFKKLNDRLQPYFDALNVLAGAESHAALVYGAFRMVLQLASGFPSFLEKLIAMIGRLADTFPQYDAIAKVFDGTPPTRMRQHLEYVYQDLFEFLQTVARIFTASSGKVKRPVGMIASVIWKPFDARFNGLLNRMDDHRMFVMYELEILQAQEAKDARKAADLERARTENEREKYKSDRETARKVSCETEEMRKTLDQEFRATSVNRILGWLAPPRFAEALESSQDQREEGTAQWIFDNMAFKGWKAARANVEEDLKWKKMPPWVLWVNGNPGCGKTVLASSVVEEIIGEEDSNGQVKTCYFFFKYNEPESSTIEAAYRSVLAQILHRNCGNNIILDRFLFARYDHASSSGQTVATPKELLDLIRVCASELGQITLILDGIDESDRPNLVGRKLKELVTTAPIKLICFSRPNVTSLQNLIAPSQRVGFDRNATSSDIRLFITHQIHALVDEEMLPSTANISTLTDTLVFGADGMFLWAKLMVKHLNSPALTASSRLRIINSVRFPEGLNAMYDRIVTLISNSDAAEMGLARRILLWLKHSILTTDGVHSKVLEAAVAENDDPDQMQDFTSVVVTVCGGLVECNPQQKFDFTHLTVKEYFDDQSSPRIGLAASLIPGKATAAVEITARCIEYLLYNAPKESPTQFSQHWGSEEHSSYRMSSISYFSLYWGEHLSMTVPKEGCRRGQIFTQVDGATQLLDLIHKFLETPLAVGFWVQSVYQSLHTVSTILSYIEDWSHRVLSYSHDEQSSQKLWDIVKRLKEFTMEILTVDRDWSSKLLSNPYLIWDDVLDFRQDGILSRIRQAATARPVATLAPEGPKDEYGRSIQCLSTISSTSSDGMAVGVLSVYSSSDFEHFWKGMNLSTAYQEAEQFSYGWTAKYELWSSGSMTRLASISISLPESEILLLLRQSFRQEHFKGDTFVTSFPLAISPDCFNFAILRTVYSIRQAELGSAGVCESLVLPLTFLDHFNSKWTPDIEIFNPRNDGHLPDEFHISWRDWYTYSVSFSSDGKYISFADYQKPCITHLAVFEILHKPALTAQLIRWIKIRLGPPKVQHMIFHPAQPLVAFLSEKKVWIWEFLKGEDKPVHLPTQCDKRHGTTLTLPTIDQYPWIPKQPRLDECKTCDKHKSFLKDCIIEALSFSLCGKYLLARNKKDVDVLQIPPNILSLEAAAEISHIPAVESTDEVKSHPLNSLIGLHDPSLRPGGVISGTHLFSTRGESHTPQALLLTTASHELKLEAGAHTSSSHLRLLSLPQSFSTRDTAVSLRIPLRSDEALRIMFNKTARQEYSLGEGSEGQFPTIVQRKMTSVAQVLGPASSVGLLDGNDHPDGPPQKRIKMDDEAFTLF